MLKINSKKLNSSLQSFTAGLSLMTLLILTITPITTFAIAANQKTFSTPEQAVDALISANRNNSQTELLKILGPEARRLIFSGDPIADQEARAKFLAAYDTAHQLENEGKDKEILIVGNRKWPLPIPLIRQNDKWQFNTKAGEQEILDRRIGRNELNVIEICRTYVEAQQEYARQHPLKNGDHEYAQRLLSHEGKQDGLYWPVNPGEKESPLGPLIAFAEAKYAPYHGYYYKILTRQSKNAPGGSINYLSGNQMTKGFALLAYPAKYGNSGIMTFMVNQDGIVHEKDLGPHTAKIASHIRQYDPDKSWKIIAP